MNTELRLSVANRKFRNGQYKKALETYDAILETSSKQIRDEILFNRKLTLKRLGMTEAQAKAPVSQKSASPTKAATNDSSGFDDFDAMLRRSLLVPEIKAPFAEAERRSLAFSDVLAKRYEEVALQDCIGVKVSVLMAAYNRQDTLAEAAQSVLAQSHQNLQLLIIDDGSTDRTLEVARSIAATDERVTVQANPRNVGKSASINGVIGDLDGEWVAYLDSDNVWHDRYLAAMLGALHHESDVEAAFSGQFLFKGRDGKPYAVRLATYNRNLLLNRNYIDHNSFMHRRDVFQKVGGYDEELRRCLDYDFFIRVADRAVLASVPIVLTDYYYGSSATTITADRSSIDDMHRVRSRAQSILTDPNSLDTTHPHGADVVSVSSQRMTVVIPNFESQSELTYCLDQIDDLPERQRVDVVVVDNNSSATVKTFLQAQEATGRIRLKLMPYNYGFTLAVNEGIKLADPNTDIVLMNNDAYPYPGSLDLLSRYSRHLNAGLVVPAQILPPSTPTIKTHVPFARAEAYSDVNVSIHHDNLTVPPVVSRGEVYEVKFAPFFCVYIPRPTLEKVGLLDAELGRHYRSDRLYCNSVRHIGNRKVYYVPRARVGHSLQKSTRVLQSSDRAEFREMFANNSWPDEQRVELGFGTPLWQRM